ncbi:MAG TPA: rod shape-determining protein MreD [Vicinamibacterales bacterium]|nr:rod shape-determining protein MreD [Vicinamibacterales bacterium]
MKALGVIAATLLALALQTTLARFMTRGVFAVDFVLVVVVYMGLSGGAVTGLLTGTFAGLIQDALTPGAGIIGIGGLAKTIVGFLAGVIGTQFIVAQSFPRFVVFFAGTLLNSAVVIGLYAVLGLRSFSVPYPTILGQAVGNAVLGVVAFQIIEFLPGAVERRRLQRGRVRR